jgi:hypothetical protein
MRPLDAGFPNKSTHFITIERKFCICIVVLIPVEAVFRQAHIQSGENLLFISRKILQNGQFGWIILSAYLGASFLLTGKFDPSFHSSQVTVHCRRTFGIFA